jgi:CheY-like chemotaxis protein
MQPSTDPYALVVDDDPMIRVDACAFLDDAGYRCFDAGSAVEGIAILSTNSEAVSLLFTDVEMPGDMDGFALARHVAEHWPHIEIVVASGNRSPAEGDLPPQATFIGKPFSAQMVHDHLREKLPDGKKPEPLKRAQ